MVQFIKTTYFAVAMKPGRLTLCKTQERELRGVRILARCGFGAAHDELKPFQKHL